MRPYRNHPVHPRLHFLKCKMEVFGSTWCAVMYFIRYFAVINNQVRNSVFSRHNLYTSSLKPVKRFNVCRVLFLKCKVTTPTADCLFGLSPIDSWLIFTYCGLSFEPDDLRVSVAPGQMEQWLADESKDCSFGSSCMGSQTSSDCLSMIQTHLGLFLPKMKDSTFWVLLGLVAAPQSAVGVKGKERWGVT